MIKMTLNYIDLKVESENRDVNILRLLFDDYIYKHISREAFERSGQGNHNSRVQIEDHGANEINLSIKTNKVSKRYRLGVSD